MAWSCCKGSRIILCVLVLLFGIPLGISGQSARAEDNYVTLLPKNVIDHNQIYLGDIWGGISERKAAEFVAPAPNIGSRRVFSAKELDVIAKAHQVNWRSGSAEDRITIERTRLLVTVPVSLRPIGRGEIIQPTDLGYMRVKSEQLTGNIVTETSGIIGKAAKRSLAAAAMFNINDIEAAKIVLKNAPVTVRLRTATIYLTLHAVALENGALGERIRVQNLTSKQVIVGVVRSAGLVDVEMP